MNKAAIWGFTFGIIVIILGVGIYAIVQKSEPEPVRTPVRPPATPQQAFPARPPAPPAQQQPAQNLAPGKLEMSRTLSDGGAFEAGGNVDVTVTLVKQGEEPIRAIGIVETIPEGWTYQEIVSDERPDLTPSRGHAGQLEFVWFSIPEFPASFTYRLKAPQTGAEPGAIRGETLYRTGGPEMRTGKLESVLAPAGETTAQPAAGQAAPAAQQPDTAVKRATGPELVLARNIDAPGYTPGAPLEVSLKLDYGLEDRVTALAVQEVLPEGWTFGKVTGGAGPAVPPEEGVAGTVTFIWIQVPQWPIEFSYTLNVPGGQSGAVQLEGYPVYRTSGEELRGNTVETELSPAS